MKRLIRWLEVDNQMLYPRTFIAVESVFVLFLLYAVVMGIKAI